MKLLASDVDNTLLFDGIYIKEEDLKEIKRFQKAGHLFGVCTGRSLEGVVKPSEMYDIEYDFYIVLSGSVIYNKEKEIIFEKKIPVSLVEEVFKALNEQDMTIVYRDKMYRMGKVNEDDYHAQIIDSIQELSTDYVSAFSFHFPKDQLEKATEATVYLKERFGYQLEIFQNNEHIDLAMKGCSKGNGLKMIQEYFDIQEKNVYCIGDSWNDLPMIHATKHPYTFTYAPVDVQQQVECIVENLGECVRDILK